MLRRTCGSCSPVSSPKGLEIFGVFHYVSAAYDLNDFDDTPTLFLDLSIQPLNDDLVAFPGLPANALDGEIACRHGVQVSRGSDDRVPMGLERV